MSYCHLSLQEREIIQALRREGCSLREIGRQLERDAGTISRELKRNSDCRFYGPQTAQHMAQERRRQAKEPWKMRSAKLRRWVLRKLQRKWSPETIAAVLRRDYPDDPQMQLCPSTIYAWIERDYRQSGKLWRLLPLQQGRQNRKRRRARKAAGERAQIVGRVGIELRPDVVDARGRFGDWEGDTIHGRKSDGNSASLLTQIERKSRYLLVVKVPNRTAAETIGAMRKAFGKIPRALRKTLTLDNGKEFASCPTLQKQLGLDVYYADPYAAWQRGANEQANGLLRRFFPKKTDFSQVTPQQVARAAELLNHLPRKCLQYQTPHEVFWKEVRQQQH